MKVQKAFQKTMDGDAGRSIADRKGKSYAECIFILVRKTAAPSIMKGVQYNQPTGRWLAGPPGG